MTVGAQRSVYEKLGVKRVINAVGNATVLGGSTLGPKVKAAMEDAGQSFVEMEDLLDKSGKAVAALLGCEAALVTSGCFAAQVLGTAGIMSGKDPAKIARIP
ncbi:MAG: selenocysteine synthase, partial [Acidobacteria bacterium]|nr:selenocysteine synthase [Acidobacteriota bacterium]